MRRFRRLFRCRWSCRCCHSQNYKRRRIIEKRRDWKLFEVPNLHTNMMKADAQTDNISLLVFLSPLLPPSNTFQLHRPFFFAEMFLIFSPESDEKVSGSHWSFYQFFQSNSASNSNCEWRTLNELLLNLRLKFWMDKQSTKAYSSCFRLISDYNTQHWTSVNLFVSEINI